MIDKVKMILNFHVNQKFIDIFLKGHFLSINYEMANNVENNILYI